MRRRSLTLVCGSLLTLFGCDTKESLVDTPIVGADAGTEADAGGGGSTGDACAPTGTGSLEIQITGLPAGALASLVLEGAAGAQTITEATTLELPAGRYTATAARVADDDAIVRTLYEHELETSEVCVTADASARIELRYAPIATSNRLWTNNQNGDGDVVGFGAPALAETAEVAPTVVVSAGAGRDLTFDADGNVWSMGATLADPHLMRLPRDVFDASGEKAADRSIDIEGLSCIPALRALAFDPGGSLWVSACGGRVVALGAGQLASSGVVAPFVTLSNLTENGDLAFDAAGNLWLTADGRVVRFDAARLGESSDAPPAATLRVRDAGDAFDLGPSNLAFDQGGNLWVIDFGGNLVTQILARDLEGEGEQTVVSAVTIALGVSALLERPAFDESGGLWLALAQNQIGRLSPEQLLTSSNPGAPTAPAVVLTSPGMGAAKRMAFYPAAAGLPLYHRFP